MSTTSLILSVLMTCAFALLIAPSVFALNRGKLLRNIALWLGLFVGLTLIYQNLGPGSPHPMFSLPFGVSAGSVNGELPPPAKEAAPGDKKQDDGDGSQGYTPPRE